MKYTIYVYLKNVKAPEIQRTGSLEVATRTAKEYSADDSIEKVVIKNNDNLLMQEYVNGVAI